MKESKDTNAQPPFSNALITGGAGFIGSHLAEELLQLGTKVTVLDDLSTGRMENIQHLIDNPNFTFQKGSVLDIKTLKPRIEANEITYHLAAAVGVKYIMKHPIRTLETNIQGTKNVLNLSQKLDNRKVILASSSEIYGKNSKIPYSEENNRVLGPTSVSRWGYSCSKALDEFLGLAYWKEKELPVVILRLFNTVGPRQVGHYGMVLPKFISQALNGNPITVYGDGGQRRSFTYVKDVVEAMIKLSFLPEAEGEIFNVGSDQEISIDELARLVKEVIDSKSEIVHVPYEEVFEEGFEDMQRRLPDISKIKSYIEYNPRNDLKKIIEEMAEEMRSRS